MRGLISRWSARTGVITLAIVLTLCLGLTLAAANLDSGSETSSTDGTATPDSSVSASTSPSPDGSKTSGSSTSGGGGGTVNNEVIVQNRTDNHFAHREGLGIARVTGGDVSNTNSAAAVASCTDCRTVAIATQIVLVMGDSSNISPVNQAVAINGGCVRCETAALAYQYVVSTGGMVRFNAEGNQQLAALQAEIRSLATNSEISFPELEAQVDAVVEQMWAVVDSEIVAVGGRPEGTEYKDSDATDEGDSEPTASPSPTAEPTPTEGGSPSVSEDEPSSTSPTPTEEPTPSESPASTEPEPTPTSDPSP